MGSPARCSTSRIPARQAEERLPRGHSRSARQRLFACAGRRPRRRSTPRRASSRALPRRSAGAAADRRPFLGGAIALALALEPSRAGRRLALIAPVTHQPETCRRLSRARHQLAAAAPADGVDLAIPMSIAYRELRAHHLVRPATGTGRFRDQGRRVVELRPRNFIGASRDLMAADQDLADMPARYKASRCRSAFCSGPTTASSIPAAARQGFGHESAGRRSGADRRRRTYDIITSADEVAAFIARIAQRVAAAGAKPAPVA